MKHLYTSSLDTEEADDMSRFFNRTLQIPACSVEDILAELRNVRDTKREDFDHITELYKYLSEMDSSETNGLK